MKSRKIQLPPPLAADVHVFLQCQLAVGKHLRNTSHLFESDTNSETRYF
jgi:hypothetical protein